MNSLVQDRAVILIIDSDPLMLTGMAAVLHMQGYECHCAQGREAAIKAVQTLALDLIICDVQLRQKSGVELYKELRQLGAQNVPALFICGHQQTDVIRRVSDNGGTYFLRKPFQPAVLAELVENALWMPHLVQTNLEQAGAAPLVANEQPGIQTRQDAAAGEQEIPAGHSHSTTPAPKISGRGRHHDTPVSRA